MRLMFLLLVLLGALSQAASAQASTSPADAGSAVSQAGYQVGPGDVIKVKVYNEADLSGSYPVGETGGIDLPLVGIYAVSGQDVEEIARGLTAVLEKDFLVDPQVSVQVETFASRKVKVMGAVRKPGVFSLTGEDTLLDVLAAAGGVVTERSSAEVQVKRARTGELEPLIVGLDDLMSRGEGNIQLQAGDTVYVPEGVFVYISGQVVKPGQINWREGMTVSQAILAVGGPMKTANLRKAYILRSGERVSVNLRRVLKGKDPDVPMQQGDQLFVDESVF